MSGRYNKKIWSWYKNPRRKKFAWWPTKIKYQRVWLEIYVERLDWDIGDWVLREWCDRTTRNNCNLDDEVMRCIRQRISWDDVKKKINRYRPEDLL